MARITIIGAGMMGSALAFPARENGNTVNLVGTHLDAEIIEACRRTGRHPKLNRTFPGGIYYYYYEEIAKALPADVVICGVSSFGVEWFNTQILPHLKPGTPVLSVTKGLMHTGGGKLINYPEYWKAAAAGNKIYAIGGGCTSYELVAHDPTLVTYCGENLNELKILRDYMQTDYYNIRLSPDTAGVECAVALKNAYALAVAMAIGISERENGENTVHYNSQAGIFTQSITEMRGLLKLIAGSDAALDVAAGDLYVTVFGGRTREIGRLLGLGYSIEQAERQLKDVTLESLLIIRRTVAALKEMDSAGAARLSDYPLLRHIGRVVSGEADASDMPWTEFTR